MRNNTTVCVCDLFDICRVVASKIKFKKSGKLSWVAILNFRSSHLLVVKWTGTEEKRDHNTMTLWRTHLGGPAPVFMILCVRWIKPNVTFRSCASIMENILADDTPKSSFLFFIFRLLGLRARYINRFLFFFLLSALLSFLLRAKRRRLPTVKKAPKKNRERGVPPPWTNFSSWNVKHGAEGVVKIWGKKGGPKTAGIFLIKEVEEYYWQKVAFHRTPFSLLYVLHPLIILFL